MIGRLEQWLRQVAEPICEQFAQLRVDYWSHSVGARTQFDGWSLGFHLLGLKYTIEFEVVLHNLSRDVGLMWAEVLWKRPAAVDRQIINLDDSHWRPIGSKIRGPEQVLKSSQKRLVKALRQAVLEGFKPQMGICGAVVSSSPKYPLSSVLRHGLTPEEEAVYEAWLSSLRGRGIQPIRLSAWQPVCGIRPDSPELNQTLQQLVAVVGDEAEALVGALYSADQIPLFLLGSNFETVGAAGSDWVQWDEWREFYLRHPDGHGEMSLSPVGFGPDQAVLVAINSTFDLDEDLGETDCLGAGPHLVSLRQIGGGKWRVVYVRRLSWTWYAEVVSLGRIIIHFAHRQAVRVVARWEGRVHLQVGCLNILLVDPEVASAPFHWNGSTVVANLHNSDKIIAALEQLLEADGET